MKAPLLARLRRAALVGLATVLAPSASAQLVYCDCDMPGDGPCGNELPTALYGGCVNSLGAKAVLDGFQGTLSVSADDLMLEVHAIPVGEPGILFMGSARQEVPFGDGQLCVGAGASGIHRYPVQVADVNFRVTYGPDLVAFSQQNFSPAGHIAAGDRWFFQFWYRDPSGPCGTGFNTSNGFGILFTP